MTVLSLFVSRIWTVLMAATCASTWWLSKDGFSHRVAAVAIFLIAAFKIRLVLLHFMELRTAPIAWRLYFEGWTLLSTAAILGIYLNSPVAI